MMAMVSSAARDRRILRLPRSRRPTHSACAAVVTSIQPPAISRSSTPASRAEYSWPSARSPASTSSVDVSSASLISPTGSGWSDENSSASIAALSCRGGMRSGLLFGPGQDRDVGEVLGLADARLPQLDQLEQGDERHDHLGARPASRQELDERHAALVGERVDDERQLVVDLELLALHLVQGLRLGRARHHAVERVEQVEQRGRRARQRAGVVLRSHHAALEQLAALLLPELERARRLLELPVLDQALHQLLAR